MSIRYVIHDVDIETDEVGLTPGPAPAARALLRMQGVGEIGAVMLVPCSEAPVLVTTGFGSSRPDLAFPLYWIKRSAYLPPGQSVVRLEWEPVVGAAAGGTLPGRYDMEVSEHSLMCLEVELCQVLMMLTIECGRRALNRMLPSHIVEWYRSARQRPLPELSAPLFDAMSRPAPILWTRRAAEQARQSRGAASGENN